MFGYPPPPLQTPKYFRSKLGSRFRTGRPPRASFHLTHDFAIVSRYFGCMLAPARANCYVRDICHFCLFHYPRNRSIVLLPWKLHALFSLTYCERVIIQVGLLCYDTSAGEPGALAACASTCTTALQPPYQEDSAQVVVARWQKKKRRWLSVFTKQLYLLWCLLQKAAQPFTKVKGKQDITG